MKKYKSRCCYIFCCLWFILFMPFCGKNPLKKEEKNSGPFFWKAEKEQKISYFLGTIHTGVTLEDLQCSELIKSHLENSSYLFVESDAENDSYNFETHSNNLTFIEGSSVSKEFASLNRNSQDFFRSRTIPTTLNYEGYQTIIIPLCWLDTHKNYRLMTKNCSSLGFPLDLVCLKDSASVGLSSLDGQIESIARKKGLTIDYLDAEMDTDAVLKVITDTDGKEKNEAIDEAVLNFDKNCSALTSVIDQYKKGHLDDADSISDDSKFVIVMLKNRNEKWMDKFRPVHDAHEQIFTAAGNSHFTKNFNMLDMLKAEGFSIKRMKASCQF